MNDKDPIEEALRAMSPNEMPPQLMARLTAARPQAGSRVEWRHILFRWLLPLTASACVAVATFFWLENARPSGAVASEPQPPPVESQDYLVSARPVGIVVAPNQRPYRIMEVEWLEHETVRTGAGGQALHTATTRRDVIPVALELY